MKTIETQRLILRPYTIQDINALHKILSNKVTMQFWPEPYSIEQTRSWIERARMSYEENNFGRLAVELKESGNLIGDSGIMQWEYEGKIENDLGYIIHADYWGRGFGTEAAKACLDYGFNEIGLSRIAANMAFDNIASIRVAEKSGMTREKEFLNKRNRDILTYLYSISKS